MSTMTKEKVDFKKVSATFEDYNKFVHALTELEHCGFNRDDISVLMSEQTRDSYFRDEDIQKFSTQIQTKAPEGIAAGGVTGGLLGALVGAMTVVGAIAVPGTQFLAVGPIIGFLSGGAAGAAAGGLIGGLIGLGIPEHEAKFFEESVKERDHVLLVVSTPEKMCDRVEKILNKWDAEKVNTF